ncbi:hypothetical protein AA313_de0205861 [Arthrobotrys entomopaga]|nr:hypothetical protein AA313_de0205861 [Arthrobotrys entomopaga]
MTPERETFLSTPAEVPSLPWGIDGQSRNIWTKGPFSTLPGHSAQEEGSLTTNTNPAKMETIPPPELSLPSGDRIARVDPKLTQDEPPLTCPIVDLPDELKGLSVNQIFALSLERCLAKGKKEDEERARKMQQGVEDEEEDKKSTCSISSSEACSEDLAFISSVNVLSMRKREIKRAQKARMARDAELGIIPQASSSSASSPAGDTLNAGDTSFASANSDPEPADDTPLFTIRSKKAPIKIVDPRTLQQPDKLNVRDLEFLRRGLRVLGTAGDLTKDAYNMFKTVGMDTVILDKTSKWLMFIQDFVREGSATLRDAEAVKRLEIRANLYQSVYQMMHDKKKIDNSILGWTNFAISMFTVIETSDGKRAVFDPEEITKEKRSPKVPHMHGKACEDMNHELQKLTEGNRLKFKTLLTMLIESLGECKDWILKAPSYSKAKLLKISEFKPTDGPTIPYIAVEPPKVHETGKQASGRVDTSEPRAKVEEANRVNTKFENETNASFAPVNTGEVVDVKSHFEPDHESDKGQQVTHHNQQTVWYPNSYSNHGYGYQQSRTPGSDFVQHSGAQVLRPRSAVNQPMISEAYHQSHGSNNYQYEAANKHVQRNQHNLPRGRQGARSGAQSRSGSAGVRQGYGSYHNNPHVSQPYPNMTPPSGPVGDFNYNPESGAYQEVRYAYPQHQQGYQQNIHHQHTHQPHQQWRPTNVNNSDGGYADTNSVQQHPASNSGQTAEQNMGSGELARQQDRRAATPSSQNGGTMTPQILQHTGLLHPPGTEQYHPPASAQMYAQGGHVGMYSGYTHATWHTGHSHQLHQQQVAQARGQKQGAQNPLHQQFPHHGPQYR